MIGLGQWARNDVPHSGWHRIEIVDVLKDRGVLSERCDMCETEMVRFMHVMDLPDHHEISECGCICAGAMQEEPPKSTKEAGRDNIISAADSLLKMPLTPKQTEFVSVMRHRFASNPSFRPSDKQWNWFKELYEQYRAPINLMLKATRKDTRPA
jgi:hypothetical protein